MTTLEKITFTVAEEEGGGGYDAFWDNPAGGGITTNGGTLSELEANITDAVLCHFGEQARPKRVTLKFTGELALQAA